MQDNPNTIENQELRLAILRRINAKPAVPVLISDITSEFPGSRKQLDVLKQKGHIFIIGDRCSHTNLTSAGIHELEKDVRHGRGRISHGCERARR